MKFLNGKEQVIDIEITSYGRYLISKGKFSPHYYSFFDDGVLYDSEYASTTELQNDIQNRIKNDTPRLEAQANYAGCETKVAKVRERFTFEDRSFTITGELNGDPWTGSIHYTEITPKENAFLPPIQADADKFYSLTYPIGSSDLNTNSAPSWNISTLQGLVSSSSNHLTGAFTTERIPQLNLNPVEYQTIVGKVPANSDVTEYDYYFEEDESFINIIPGDDEIIIAIAENNAFFGEQNFDIEVYEVESETVSGEKKQNMTPLYFVKKTELVKDGILVDEDSDEIIRDATSRGFLNETEGDLNELRSLDLDSSYVGYYFSIDTDNEIDEETLCKLTVDNSQGIFSERDLYCSKIEKREQFDNSKVFETDATGNKIGDCE